VSAKRLLVTGAAGFVGRLVAEFAVARGHDVLGLDRRAPAVPVPGGRFVEADIRDRAAVRDAVAGVDAIVHCAAIVGPKPANADPALATEVNVTGTLAVLEAARATSTPVVNLSTATLYGNRPDTAPLDETAPTDPVGIYDATKLMAETLCDAYRKTFGVAVASFRTSFVYGAQHSTGDYFVERALAGETEIDDVGRDHPCDFTYVRDLALGLVQAAEAGPLPEPVYNLSGGVLRTRGDLGGIVASHFPGLTIRQAPGVDPGRHLRGVCLIERAGRDFGYRPAFTLETGIADWIARVRGEIAA